MSEFRQDIAEHPIPSPAQNTRRSRHCVSVGLRGSVSDCAECVMQRRCARDEIEIGPLSEVDETSRSKTKVPPGFSGVVALAANEISISKPEKAVCDFACV
jgi:hypothetical protein